MFVELAIFIISSLFFYYLYVHKKIHNFFVKRGVKFLPGIPMFGNVCNSLFTTKHFIEDLEIVYRAFPDERYVGFIEGTTPIILIRDPELAKAITVKDFDHFVNHKDFFSKDTDPLFGGSLFMMKDDKWRDMRFTLSPAFTGSKMRLMMNFMSEVSHNIMDYLKENNSDEIHVDDLVRRYTLDVIASAGFGLQVNSVKDKKNDFFKMGINLFYFNIKQKIIIFISTQFPKIGKKLGLTLFSKEVMDFFKTTVKNTISYRENNNVVRPDMIQLLMEATKGTLKAGNTEKDEVTTTEDSKSKTVAREWTEDEIIGQVFIFFAAGFESSAGAITMAIHELAVNPEVQEKLYQEIKQFEKINKVLSYENVSQLKYMDCVINETLRKWTAAIFMDRVCTKPYELPPPRKGGKPYLLNPGDIVYNMVNVIHMDEKYHPKPEVFDPDRFSDENKHKIQPFTFVPFGMGPRNCIASRFAILEMKVFLYDLVLHYKVVKSKRTSDPIRLHSNDFNIRALGGTYVKFEPRD
ncbi:probable cytochrome P450 9f2 [Galleria mellonella]|uniref:unspecific monooxygenase n=1 Tax=Galleria mellonella TaxID=7137 RepID=A0ABM3MHL0_GALME|nr:probable cytochrome P450 9f2 [Galleria mellonella]